MTESDTSDDYFYVLLSDMGEVRALFHVVDGFEQARKDETWTDLTWEEIEELEGLQVARVAEEFVARYDDANKRSQPLTKSDLGAPEDFERLDQALRALAPLTRDQFSAITESPHEEPAVSRYSMSISDLASMVREVRSDKWKILTELRLLLFLDEPKHPIGYMPISILTSILETGPDAKRDRLFALRNGNAGIRAIATVLIDDDEALRRMANDPCGFVRTAVAINSQTPEEVLRVLGSDPWNGVQRALQHRSIDEGNVENIMEADETLPPEQCSCLSIKDPEGLFEEFEEAELTVPLVPIELEGKVRRFGPWRIGTQPFPLPMEDYLLSSAEYLKEGVPDQFCLSHAGHGVNSYGLNLRVAYGPLALLAQVWWGGVYGDNNDAEHEWETVVREIDFLLTQIPPLSIEEFCNERDLLVIYSDFRMMGEKNGFEVYVRENGVLKERPDITSWRQVRYTLRDLTS